MSHVLDEHTPNLLATAAIGQCLLMAAFVEVPDPPPPEKVIKLSGAGKCGPGGPDSVWPRRGLLHGCAVAYNS